MATEWYEAPQAIIDLAKDVIEKHHPDLKEARIGFIMRSDAPVANGGVTYGQARVVSARDQVHMPFDFIIWLAADTWADLTAAQQRALVDHELMHCKWDPAHEKATIRLHDIEEFAAIIQRHGYWSPAYGSIAPTLQQGVLLPEARRGTVGAVHVDGLGTLQADDPILVHARELFAPGPNGEHVEVSVQRAHR
jgi:hypothetical protein